MNTGVIVDVLLAVFAVFGLYALARMALSALFGPRDVCVAVEIRTPQQAADARFLIFRAQERFFLHGGRVVVLLSPRAAEDTELLAWLASEKIACFIEKEEKGG